MTRDPLARLADTLAAAPPGYGPEWSAGLRRGPESELRGWVEAALQWCDETDAIALTHFRRDLVPERKPDRTFVTVADTAIESLIRERVAEAFPGHGVIGEEHGVERGEASVRWLVDPIDGTHNFMRGVPIFATLLAAERDGELQAAVLSAPAFGERWYAWRGGGAWAVRPGDSSAARRLRVSRIGDVADAQVLYASSVEVLASGLAPGFSGLLAAAWRDRGFGDFWAYTLLAEGGAEAMFEVGLSAWDAAAPMVLVEEAGGRATDLDGIRAVSGPTFLATNGVLHDEVRRRLRAAGTPA